MPSPNPDSILDSVKKSIGLDSSDTTFDLDVTLFVNSAFGVLKQLGVGSDTGFIITDNTTLWSQYVTGLTYLGMVKNYINLFVKLVFDPPATSFAIAACEKILEELGWRILAAVEAETPPSDPFATTTTSTTSGIMKNYFAPKVVVVQYSPSITIDASSGNMFYLTMTGDCAMFAPANGVDGEHITLEIVSNGHAISWRSGWDFGDIGAPTLSAGGKADIVSAYYKTASASWRAGFTTGF
jgi:hypothetical protein